MDSQTNDGPSRAALIVALVVAVGAVAALLVVAAVRQRPPAPAPVAIASAPAPQADSPDCAALLAAVPDQLGEYHRAPVVEPAPAGAAAWQTDTGGEALILRCGLQRPVEFVIGAPIQMVDAVQWFQVGDGRVGEAGVGGGRSTWFTVDRPVYVALTLPAGTGPTPIQDLSAVIADSLAETPIDPAPAP